MDKNSAVAVTLMVMTMIGCDVGPRYSPPLIQVNGSWSELSRTDATKLASKPTTRPVSVDQWWASLRDPNLDALIAEAVKSGYDVRLAQARVREARAQRNYAAGGEWPQINASGSYTRARFSENGIPFPATPSGNGGSTTITPAESRRATKAAASAGGSGLGFGPDVDLYQLGFDATWEIDIFGATRRRVESAVGELLATAEAQRDVTVSLVAEVARTYVELRGAQRRLIVAQENLQSERKTLQLTEERRKAGLVTDLDVARSSAEVSSTEAQVPPLRTGIRQAIHRLGVLIGKDPDALSDQLTVEGPIPIPPPEVAVGVPSELLRRRADIRQAERQLAAATARTAGAVADLFPRFSLTGALGLQSLNGGDLFESGSRFYSVSPAISWPIFTAGRLRANIDVQNARQEQALIRYERTVRNALGEVEDAIVAYGSDQNRRESLSNAVSAQRRAVSAAREQYRQGVVDFLVVLDTERFQFQAEQELALSEQAVTVDLIALYKALGGGWEQTEVAAAAGPNP